MAGRRRKRPPEVRELREFDELGTKRAVGRPFSRRSPFAPRITVRVLDDVPPRRGPRWVTKVHLD
jgi:hypothetical protein